MGFDATQLHGENPAVKMDGSRVEDEALRAPTLKQLWMVLAALSLLLCAVLAFTRPYASWEWIPAILGLAIFGTLAGRKVTRTPYPNTAPALTLALLVPGYHAIAAINRERALFQPELGLDAAIPLEPAWMIAYGSIWFFAFLPVFVLRGPQLTRRALYAFIAVVVAAYVGFLLYPTVLPRPSETGAGFFAWTLRINYDLDPPLNCFPSLHVAWAFVAALACHCVHKRVGVAALAWAALIAISTLFTKQHYVVDVLAGVAIAYGAYAVFLRPCPEHAVAERDRLLAPRRALRAVWIYLAVVAASWIVFTLGR